MLNIAFIGSGKSTNRYHLPFILERKNLRVKTIYSPNCLSSKWPKIPNINYTENIDDVLKDAEIDVIVITTNQSLHYELAKKALEANKNVVLEKPFTNTYSEARELFDIANSKGLVLEAYQNRLFDSDYLTVNKIIESGKLGEIYEIENNFDYYRKDNLLASSDKDKYQSFIYGHGAHTIDQAIHTFGKPDKVNIDIKALVDGKMLDYFDVDLYYGKLKYSCRSSYLRALSRPSFVVYGTNGTFIKENPDKQENDLKKFYMPSNSDFGLDLANDYGTIYYYENDELKIEKVKSEVGDYGRYYDYLYETIVNKKPKLVSDEETLTLMEILEQAVERR